MPSELNPLPKFRGSLRATVFTLLLLGFLLIGCGSGSQKLNLPNNTDPAVLEVIGVSHELSDKKWQDNRIGLGLKALLTQTLYETGKFRLLETDQSIEGKRSEIAAGLWAGLYKHDDVPQIAQKSPSEFQAFARVIYFGRPRSGASFGVVHSSTQTTVIRIEVTMFRKGTSERWSAIGEGKSSTTASSVLFTFHQNRADFDQSNIGNAVKAAIEDAVEQLIK